MLALPRLHCSCQRWQLPHAAPMSRDTSVYVHFPWCARKCPYCDFATTKRAAEDIPHRAYADSVISELRARDVQGRRLYSVFFGGGTPSLWSTNEVGRVLGAIRDAFDSQVDELEVTAECNPASLSEAQARGLVEAGVGRLSVGVQSLRDEQLRFLGRLHDRELALQALEHARVAPRRSADLMFGMPRQQALHEEIDAVLATGVDHVSAYALTIESGTQFGERHRLGKLEVSDDDVYADLYEQAEARFAAAGLEHYEVSNYARPGEESRHNAHYWRGGDYLGLGAAAVGCLSEGTSARRYKNTLDAEAYMGCDEGADTEMEHESLDAPMRIQEAFMLGLRTREGVDLRALEARVGHAPLNGREREVERRLAQGDLVLEGDRLRVPSKRWLVLDGIVADLF